MYTFNIIASEREKEREREAEIFFQMVPLHKLDDPGGDNGSVALNPAQQVQT